MSEVIVALATPNGRSGVGVIRISGERALSILRDLVDDEAFSPNARNAYFRQLLDPETHDPVDNVLVTYFKAPNSFTGEDVVEISCHGSPVLLRQVLDVCLSLGARMAEPGEFSLRAVSNSKIDLSEAEAIRDLIDAQTTASARQAVRQMRGELSLRLQPLKDDLLNVIVLLESALEFVEDDLPANQLEDVTRRLNTVADDARRLADTFRAGHLIRDGIKVAIVGQPNVGKSSLFNYLLGHDRAIVTDIAGTTRDQLYERLEVFGVPVSLIDTAGLRESDDVVEAIGVERSKAVMADADVVVVLLDASEQTSDEDRQILNDVKELNFVVALNKIDKVPSTDVDHMIAAKNSHFATIRDRIIPISAKTGEGIDELKRSLVDPSVADQLSSSGFLISDARHHDLLLRTYSEIEASISDLSAGTSEEIVLVGLHNALKYLGEITGETTTEDMLTRVFSTFCIGK
ncbi:MAG TPA: tRNA uridine-5-carboxymethylaminomethyl(34) synthesis GTPase MnmE [Pyrinomonadaceae bacterium]|nr:tRNA uridine-5-carboxymethylaminomethyl(34) synthesis GTPase MnmE [Pyrinomonadaceae bacterium]